MRASLPVKMVHGQKPIRPLDDGRLMYARTGARISRSPRPFASLCSAIAGTTRRDAFLFALESVATKEFRSLQPVKRVRRHGHGVPLLHETSIFAVIFEPRNQRE